MSLQDGTRSTPFYKLSITPDEWHHKFFNLSVVLLWVGLLINIVTSLLEGEDIGFFSANAVFTSLSTILFCAIVVARLTKDLNFFCFVAVLALANIAYSIQPIKMWTDEGNLCSSLSTEEQAIGRECYLAAAGAVNADESESFSDLITLVTSCYSNNNILTGASGVCYNIRWGQSNGSTLRAFMFISWLSQFFGTLIALGCSLTEIIKQGERHLDQQQIQPILKFVALNVLAQHTNHNYNPDQQYFSTAYRILNNIVEKENNLN